MWHYRCWRAKKRVLGDWWQLMLSNTVNQRLTRMTSFRAPVTRSIGFARLCDLCDLAYRLLWMKPDGEVMARTCGEKSHRKASVHVHCEWTKQEKIAAIDLGSFLGYLNSKYCMGLAFCTERHERSSALALRWKLMPINALLPALFCFFWLVSEYLPFELSELLHI